MKKNAILTVLLFIASVLVIFFGRQYAARQEQAMLEDSLDPETSVEASVQEDSEADTDSDKSVSAEEQLAKYDANSDSLSLLEQIDYKVLTNDAASIAYYGDIDTSSEWFSSMDGYISNQVNGTITFEDITYPESDTYTLYIQQTASNVILTETDVVIYGMPALPDKIRDIGIAETNDYLSSILSSLTSGLPEAELIIMQPAPILAEIDNLNSRSLDYRRYMNEMTEVAEKFNLPILSTHDRFLLIAEEEGYDLEELYTSDGIDLNDQGTDILQRAIEAELTEEPVE